MFGNFGSMMAAAVNRAKANQQTQQPPQAMVGYTPASQSQQSVIGSTVSQGGPGGMIANAINKARAARANQGPSIPGVPGGMMASIMRGRNLGNQNQLSSTTINPSAFNTGTVGQVFNQNYVDPVLAQKKPSPLRQDISNSVDPMTGQYIDPTMSQGLDPGTVDPMLDQGDTSLTQY